MSFHLFARMFLENGLFVPHPCRRGTRGFQFNENGLLIDLAAYVRPNFVRCQSAPEKVGFVASGRVIFLITKKIPRFGPEVTVMCLGVFVSLYNFVWSLPDHFGAKC